MPEEDCDGWHWDDECLGGDVFRALVELHRQAHGGSDLEACGKSPCNTIRYEAIERMRANA
jgi:hypothetical protein